MGTCALGSTGGTHGAEPRACSILGTPDAAVEIQLNSRQRILSWGIALCYSAMAASKSIGTPQKSKDLLLPVMPITAESIRDTAFGDQVENVHAEGHTNSRRADIYLQLASCKNQQESFQPRILKFKTGPAETGMTLRTGKSQPSQTKPQAKGLLLPVGALQRLSKTMKIHHSNRLPVSLYTWQSLRFHY